MTSIIASPASGSGKKHRIRKYANRRQSCLEEDSPLQNSNSLDGNGNEILANTLEDNNISLSDASFQSKRSSGSGVIESLFDSTINDTEELISFNRESYSASKKTSKQSRKRRNFDSPNRRLTANMEDLQLLMREMEDEDEENKRPKNTVQESPERTPQPVKDSSKSVRTKSTKVSTSSEIQLRRSPRHITTPVPKDVRRQTADGDEIKRLVEDLYNDNSTLMHSSSNVETGLEDSTQEDSLSINISTEYKSVSRNNRSSLRSASAISSLSAVNEFGKEDRSITNEDMSNSNVSSVLTPSYSRRKSNDQGVKSRNRRETADSSAIAQLINEIQAEDSCQVDMSTIEDNEISFSKDTTKSASKMEGLFHEPINPEYTNSDQAVGTDISNMDESSVAASDVSLYSLSKHCSQSRRNTADPADIAQLILELRDSPKGDTQRDVSSSAILDSSQMSNNTVDTFKLVQSVEDVLQQELVDRSPLLSDVLGSKKVAQSPLLSDSAMTDSIGDVWQIDRQELDLSEVRTSPATVYMESMLLDSSRDESRDTSIATIGTVNLLQSVEAALEEDQNDISTYSNSMRSLAGLLTANLDESGMDSTNTINADAVEPAKKRRLSSRRKANSPKVQLGITPANATVVTISPRKLTTAAAAAITSNQPLKSCLSNRKQKRGLEKSVVFGSPAFAEFNHLSPPSRITPLTKRQSLISSRKLRQQEEDENHEKVLDPVTEENNRILQEWDRLADNTTNSPEESEDSRYSTHDSIEHDFSVKAKTSNKKGRNGKKKRRLSKIHPDLSHDQGLEEEVEELPSTLEDLLVRETRHEAEEDENLVDVSRTQEVEVDLGHLLRRLSQDGIQVQYNSAEDFEDKGDDSRLGLLLGRDRAEWDEQQSSYDDEINNSTIQDLIYQDGKRLNLSTSQPLLLDQCDNRSPQAAFRSSVGLSIVQSPQLGVNAAGISQLELSVSGNLSVHLPFVMEDDDATAKLEDNLLAVLTAAENVYTMDRNSPILQQKEPATLAEQSAASEPENLWSTSINSCEMPEMTESTVEQSEQMDIEDRILEDKGFPQPTDDAYSPECRDEGTNLGMQYRKESVIQAVAEEERDPAIVPSQSSALLLQRLRALTEVSNGSENELQFAKKDSVGIADVDHEWSSNYSTAVNQQYSRSILNTNWTLDENSVRNSSNQEEAIVLSDNVIEKEVQYNETIRTSLLSFILLLQQFRNAVDEQSSEKLCQLVRSSLKDAAIKSSFAISLPGNGSLCRDVAADFDRLWALAADRSAEDIVREYLQDKKVLIQELLHGPEGETGIQIDMEQFEARWLTESALAVNKAKQLLGEQHQSEKDRPVSSSISSVMMHSSPSSTHTTKADSFQLGDKFYNKVLHNTPAHQQDSKAARIEPSITWNALRTAEKEAADLQFMVNIENSLTYCEVTTLQSNCICVNAYLTPRVIATIRFNIEQVEKSSQSQGAYTYGLSDMEVDITLGRNYSSIG